MARIFPPGHNSRRSSLALAISFAFTFVLSIVTLSVVCRKGHRIMFHGNSCIKAGVMTTSCVFFFVSVVVILIFVCSSGSFWWYLPYSNPINYILAHQASTKPTPPHPSHIFRKFHDPCCIHCFLCFTLWNNYRKLKPWIKPGLDSHDDGSHRGVHPSYLCRQIYMFACRLQPPWLSAISLSSLHSSTVFFGEDRT